MLRKWLLFTITLVFLTSCKEGIWLVSKTGYPEAVISSDAAAVGEPFIIKVRVALADSCERIKEVKPEIDVGKKIVSLQAVIERHHFTSVTCSPAAIQVEKSVTISFAEPGRYSVANNQNLVIQVADRGPI